MKTQSKNETSIDKYFRESLINFQRSSIFLLWANKSVRYTIHYLLNWPDTIFSAPPTSVPTESLFSNDVIINDGKQN